MSSIPPNTQSNHRPTEPLNFHDLYWGHSDDLHSGKEVREPSLRKRVRRLLSGSLYHLPLLRGFLLELRSLVCRMVLRYERRCYLYGFSVGPLHQIEGGHLCWNTRTRACILDMKSFEASRPWATMVDWEVYRDGWVKGAEWAERNSCKSGPDNLSREPSSD